MILIIHFGGQYTQLIRRALNELGVEGIVVRPAEAQERLPSGLAGVILSGGPASVDEASLTCVRAILSWRIPVLGICLGHQLLVAVDGGTVAQLSREYGPARLRITAPSALTRYLRPESKVWMSHGDTVTALPPSDGWSTVGATEHGPHAVIANEARRLYGVQFHPEVTHTDCGPKILETFVRDICRSPHDFNPENLVNAIQERIREHVGPTGHIMVACSLGVDSTTVATLCARALGPHRVHPVFINNGLQREEDLALAKSADAFLPQLIIEHAEDLFLSALEGVEDPEQKRWRVGESFWTALEAVARRRAEQYPIVAFTLGTLAPDVIESGSESIEAAVIKTHHNLVPPPPTFPFAPFEPLRDLYKDQVRAAGREAGVPEQILSRHPFPGPGLAIRVLGKISPERLNVARACDTIFINALREEKLYDVVSQAFVTVGSDRLVLVHGDAGAWGWPVNLCAFTTRDFMTATIVEPFWSFLGDVMTKLHNSVRGVGRVLYTLTTKPPGTMEWE